MAQAKEKLSSFGLLQFFCDAKRAEVRADMGNASLPEVARKLGEMWKALGAEDKAGYEAQAAGEGEGLLLTS